jgi:integrase
MALTVKRVVKALSSGKPGRYFDGQGLYLVVNSERAASWSRRYELNFKAHWLGLGSARAFDLEEARARNRRISQQLADGIDPLHERQAERAERQAAQMKSRTFRECAEEYIGRHQSEWKSAKHGLQWRDSLERFVFKKIGDLPVASIDKPLVLSILEQHIEGDNRYPASGKFWLARTTTADRTRNRIELVLNFATAAGYRPEGPNPAAWGSLKDLLASPTKINGRRRHHAALPYAEVPAFLQALRQHEGVGARALEFTILTAARLGEVAGAQSGVGEVAGAQWSEIDLDAGMWTIPAARMKGGQEHRVPLSSPVIMLLKALPTERGNDNVFVGARGDRVSQAAVTILLKRVGYGAITVHGFRSTFSDWVHERTAFSNHVIELSLAHAIGNEVEKAYRRGDMFDKRRKLMEAWAAFVTTPTAAGAVVTMRRA